MKWCTWPVRWSVRTLNCRCSSAEQPRAEPAVKIAPNYSQPVVHVLDASRAVPVTSSLLSDDGKAAFVAQHRADYEQLRRIHSGPKQKLMTIEAARANRTPITWRAEDVAQPSITGIHVLDDVSLAT